MCAAVQRDADEGNKVTIKLLDRPPRDTSAHVKGPIMPIEKPLPLMVGNKAYYSLTSYDPVEIEVNVPYTSDEDIELGLEMTLADMGGSLASLDDPTWVAEHFEGLHDAGEVREAMRQEVLAMNANAAEQQKVGECVEALGTGEPHDAVEAEVREFIDRLTGKQTIYQCMALDEAIVRRGGGHVDPLVYKTEYLRRLAIHIADRKNGLAGRSFTANGENS